MKLSMSGLAKKTKFWTEAVTDLTSVTQAFPQAAYSGLQKSLQQEWQFVQRVPKRIGPEFASVEQTLAENLSADSLWRPVRQR
jgi:hypothetical protein